MRDLRDVRRLGRVERWPGRMAAALGANHLSSATDWQVVEEGHPGRTTVHPDPIEGEHKNGLAVLPAILESHRPIDCAVLMLGTNDLKARFSVTPIDIAVAVERLVQTIAGSEAGRDGRAPAILLISPPPIREIGWLAEMFEGGEAKSQRLAKLFAEIATHGGIGFLDAGALVATDPNEGIHLDAKAHEKLGLAVAGAVAALIG
jgi:lysophospholipase L1-like esterase